MPSMVAYMTTTPAQWYFAGRTLVRCSNSHALWVFCSPFGPTGQIMHMMTPAVRSLNREEDNTVYLAKYPPVTERIKL